MQTHLPGCYCQWFVGFCSMSLVVWLVLSISHWLTETLQQKKFKKYVKYACSCDISGLLVTSVVWFVVFRLSLFDSTSKTVWFPEEKKTNFGSAQPLLLSLSAVMTPKTRNNLPNYAPTQRVKEMYFQSHSVQRHQKGKKC